MGMGRVLAAVLPHTAPEDIRPFARVDVCGDGHDPVIHQMELGTRESYRQNAKCHLTWGQRMMYSVSLPSL